VNTAEHIAKLEGKLAARDARILEQDARILEQDAQIKQLTQQVAELLEHVAILTEKLGQNSSNSHKPPSSDPPGGGASAGGGARTEKNRRKRSKRKRGAQGGHKGSHRSLLPASEVDEFIDFFPPECESCWSPLAPVQDSRASRFQATEVPPIVPWTTEYRCHSVTCACGFKTRASSADVPASSFGPRLTSIVGLLTGVYHVSRRKTVTLLSDLLGVRISLGAVSALEERVSIAIEPVVKEAWDSIGDAKVKHTDGTSWLQAGVTMSLWTIATTMVTVFKILKSGSKKTIEPLFGPLHGILVSDRDSSLTFWAMERRQICWAHLLRKFVSFSERDGPAGEMGREFLSYTALVFEYWQAKRSEELTPELYQAWMAPVRVGFEDLLERATHAGIARFSGACANMLKHKAALWTFVDTSGVDPTNNHAERELRAFVLWRRRSFGTQSERGNLFAERIMTVAHTARKQDRDVLTLLTQCLEAQSVGVQMPSLFDQGVIQAAA
jgi:transposase